MIRLNQSSKKRFNLAASSVDYCKRCDEMECQRDKEKERERERERDMLWKRTKRLKLKDSLSEKHKRVTERRN